jgi:uncharacterized protein (DUF433 family)
MSDRPRIVSDPKVLLGKPCVAGTRISVEHILREMAAGATVTELVEDYPGLTAEAIQAALEFAAEAVEHERVYETVA